jgi:hypothetical protein
MSDLAAAFTNPDPVEALRTYIISFGRFWDADRLVMRRLRALAVLDPEAGTVISARDERRHSGLETYDTLAAPGQALTHVALDVLHLAHCVLSR